MRMYTVQWESGNLDFLVVRVAWGSRGAAQRPLLSGPEWLANHWPQLPRWTERQAPNVNIGGEHWRAVLPRGPQLHDLPLFSILWDLNCSTESLLPPLNFLGEPLAIAHARLQVDPIVLNPIVIVPSSVNSATGTKT